MKNFFCIIFLFLSLVAYSAEYTSSGKIRPNSPELEGIFPRPKPVGNGPKMLLLCGGRAWVANSCAKSLGASGFFVQLLNSVYLDGFGGASIKITPTAKVEPTPLDGITPEFEELNIYQVVEITGIPYECQKKMLNQERMAILRKWVANGGQLIVTLFAPTETFGDLLPVTFANEKPTVLHTPEAYTTRPADQAFASLPERWQVTNPYRRCTAKENAAVHSWIYAPDGGKIAPYVVTMPYGKGSVLFFNGQYERIQKTRQMLSWAYTPAFQSALAAMLCKDSRIHPEKSLTVLGNENPPKTQESVSVRIDVPQWGIEDIDATVTVNGNEFLFSNGYRIRFNSKQQSFDFFYPNASKPYITGMKIPVVNYPKTGDAVKDNSTAEASGMKQTDQKSSALWHVESMKGGKVAQIIAVSDKGGRMVWSIHTGRAWVDGRNFAGFGHTIRLEKLGNAILFSSLNMNYGVDVTNRHFRRFACYQPPRGYKYYDFSGKENADTRMWGFFSDGQPFTWLEGDDAVLSEFIGSPFPVCASYSTVRGGKCANAVIQFKFGRVKAPQQTAVFWQMITDASCTSNNDWLAMYQFQRHNLRRVANIPEIPAQPFAGQDDTSTPPETTQLLKYASKNGFRVFEISRTPAPMEAYETEKMLCQYREIAANGMHGYGWFPCCHSPEVTRTVAEHPDWYLKDENGKLANYFGHFHVGDMNNPEFFAWHMSVLDKMMANGFLSVWYDMGGSASGGVNFATPESPISFWAQQKLYRHFYDKGSWMVTEGMNPLVIDGYIFREKVYNDPIGNEFCMMGAMVAGGGFRCDYFRLAMYDIFWRLNLNSVVFDFEQSVGIKAKVQEAMGYVPTIYRALDLAKMPYIREIPGGTTWIGENGGAIFCYDAVKKLEVALPEGFVPESMTVAGKIQPITEFPKAVPEKSILVFKKRNP